MEYNGKSTGAELPEEASEGECSGKRVQYTKQQSFLYTAISVALFFLIYFAVNGIAFTANRPYKMFAYAEKISAEQAAEFLAASGISQESSCIFVNARLEKGPDGYEFTALFRVNGEAEAHESIAEEIIAFEYGDPEYDVRIGFYPYSENPYYAEYAFGEKYVDIEIPSREITVFEWNGSVYAGYCQRGIGIPPEIRALFSGMEKLH